MDDTVRLLLTGVYLVAFLSVVVLVFWLLLRLKRRGDDDPSERDDDDGGIPGGDGLPGDGLPSGSEVDVVPSRSAPVPRPE